MQISGIFGLASQKAAWLSARQQTVAENIAHANIPGFVARDTEPFSAHLGTNPANLERTNPSHIASTDAANGIRRVETSTSDGQVDVETELMKSTEIRSDYELNAAIVKAFHRMILTAAKA